VNLADLVTKFAVHFGPTLSESDGSGDAARDSVSAESKR
jgi:hypothetical protein